MDDGGSQKLEGWLKTDVLYEDKETVLRRIKRGRQKDGNNVNTLYV